MQTKGDTVLPTSDTTKLQQKNVEKTLAFTPASKPLEGGTTKKNVKPAKAEGGQAIKRGAKSKLVYAGLWIVLVFLIFSFVTMVVLFTLHEIRHPTIVVTPKARRIIMPTSEESTPHQRTPRPYGSQQTASSSQSGPSSSLRQGSSLSTRQHTHGGGEYSESSSSTWQTSPDTPDTHSGPRKSSETSSIVTWQTPTSLHDSSYSSTPRRYTHKKQETLSPSHSTPLKGRITNSSPSARHTKTFFQRPSHAQRSSPTASTYKHTSKRKPHPSSH